jgi:hypothetical protein
MKIATTILFLATTALAVCGNCPYYVPSTNETCMITFDSPTAAHRDCLAGHWFDAPIVSTPTTLIPSLPQSPPIPFHLP